MEKGTGLGLQRKSMKRKKTKGFARALVDYLASDSYMYAPLIDSQPSKPPEHSVSALEEVAGDAFVGTPVAPGYTSTRLCI
ncbi:uncharacterized protein LOC110029821 isoform X2 [Phalaenopsis equestris]|uniref:uncharacterized protein LOC110029821 isoform X2 n=1 Tax=Phalaenopsis equestris TaxID=78828 RepID=UPI0009E610B7|nr:uncharacterized protein LOC110029821 isoform X2 [Phalaenopsis equestris]